jgi:hypothetical protein
MVDANLPSVAPARGFRRRIVARHLPLFPSDEGALRDYHKSIILLDRAWWDGYSRRSSLTSGRSAVAKAMADEEELENMCFYETNPPVNMRFMNGLGVRPRKTGRSVVSP